MTSVVVLYRVLNSGIVVLTMDPDIPWEYTGPPAFNARCLLEQNITRLSFVKDTGQCLSLLNITLPINWPDIKIGLKIYIFQIQYSRFFVCVQEKWPINHGIWQFSLQWCSQYTINITLTCQQWDTMLLPVHQ
jgi:hypothetical protein